MAERPILFSGEMVRAILEGRKTQTRRVVKGCALEMLGNGFTPEYVADPGNSAWCPYGKVGDRLWVRETLRRDANANVWYYAAGKPEVWVVVAPEHHSDSLVWAHHKEGDVCVSIHMPRWASRINLEITKVIIERVQDISTADAIAEGCQGAGEILPVDEYSDLWNAINSKRGFGWDANPWVWVIEFKAASPEPPTGDKK